MKASDNEKEKARNETSKSEGEKHNQYAYVI